MTVGGVGGTYILSRLLFSFPPPSPPILILGQSSCDLRRKDVTELRCTHAPASQPGTGAAGWPSEGMSRALRVPSSSTIQSLQSQPNVTVRKCKSVERQGEDGDLKTPGRGGCRMNSTLPRQQRILCVGEGVCMRVGAE